ncbi:MAG: hypothetical protein ACREK3_01480 [Gemmatimonadota bacterium]
MERKKRTRPEMARSTRLSRLLLVPVFGLYVYLILDSTPPINQSDRIAAYMLYMIVGMLAIGAIAVRLRAVPMTILCLLAALLQTFAMMLMLLIGWRPDEAVVFVNVLLILSLLFVAWQFRHDARSGPG